MKSPSGTTGGSGFATEVACGLAEVEGTPVGGPAFRGGWLSCPQAGVTARPRPIAQAMHAREKRDTGFVTT